MIASMLPHHPHRPRPDFGREFVRRFLLRYRFHGSILSRVGASGKPGAVQSGRCAPACGLVLALGVDGSNFFCPFEGGTLELLGVFAGKPSLASSSARRAVKAATCAISEAISASFCACESFERSGPAAMNPENQIRRPIPRPYKPSEAIRRSVHRA